MDEPDRLSPKDLHTAQGLFSCKVADLLPPAEEQAVTVLEIMEMVNCRNPAMVREALRQIHHQGILRRLRATSKKARRYFLPVPRLLPHVGWDMARQAKKRVEAYHWFKTEGFGALSSPPSHPPTSA